MRSLRVLFENNRAWASRVVAEEPDFFARLSAQQAPQYLWIGCADSRVPANQIVGLLPGEMFVHRNIANVVVHTDLNCLSVLQYAVDVLRVRHVIVCGHYGCGGVRAAITNAKLGLIDNWLRHVQDVQHRHASVLSECADEDARANRLCELNVIEQVRHVSETTVVQDAWLRGQDLMIHGWIYGLQDGCLRDLDVSVAASEEVEPFLDAAVLALE
ncbi:MAG TPA: carbonate dehydratase [Gemmatimonadaceae bacterium]|nr:carbonate dehydratase [Gemmatimonadaceae bacterium]